MTEAIGVRQATALDAELLARLGAETFPGNFVGQATPAAMDTYIEKNFSPAQIALELSEPGSAFFIAQAGSDEVGYAHLRSGSAPAGVTGRSTAEIHRVYVMQTHWGSGAGKALVRACLEDATSRGCDSVWLGAWSENPRALGFYRSLGFAEVGTKKFQLGEELHDDAVLERRLDRD